MDRLKAARLGGQRLEIVPSPGVAGIFAEVPRDFNVGSRGARQEKMEVKITLKQNKKSSVIHLEGAIDIALSALFKELLLEALGAGKEIKLVLDGATDLDVTAVELIWAARRAAEGAGLAFKLAGAIPEPLSSALSNAGLQQFLVPVVAR